MKKGGIFRTFLGICFVAIIVVVAFIAGVFTANGAEHECYDCNISFTEKLPQIKILGEVRDLCSDCYKEWKSLQDEINGVMNGSSDGERLNTADERETEELIPAQTMDPFSEIELVFTGISGKATATIKPLPEDSVLYNCYFDISPQFYLSSGDKVTVTLSEGGRQFLLNNWNIVPEELSKVYIVPELPKHVTDSSTLSHDILRPLSERFFAETKENTVDDHIFTYTNFQYYGTYWMTKKDTAPFWVKENTRLEFVVSYDSYANGEFFGTTYKSLVFTDIVVDTDGSLRLVYEDGTTSVFAQASREEDFDIIRLD